ncbi:RteC domain-containing protein [Kaistella palustris]|uniref:RteC domain-containing protein n=1 Tax=Kaistella palustris TaxID=493376 RepID=UPI0003F8C5F8|nr:RteC domain-containing protein [Kaistella palustris]
METKLLFDKAKQMYQQLCSALEDIQTENAANPIEAYEKALMEIDAAIRNLKVHASQTDFISTAEEVYFFKKVKPLFVSQFIYYSKILSIEAGKPNAGQYVVKEYYEFELQNLKTFVDEHYSFYEYYRRKATYLDAAYFVRRQFDFKMNVDPHLYNFDEAFTTSHDHLVSQIMANDRLEKYLLQSIYQLEGYFYEKFSNKSPITWTGSKSALIELVYALHVMHCFNGGSADFSECIKSVEKSFNIDLGNFYKTLHEIKNRKTGRTKFLQALTDHLAQHFEGLEEG